MGILYGVLIDTISIQKYIYGSNKLKENIGASFIVSNVLKEMIKSINSGALEKGYEGGGNFMLFFENEIEGNNFIKELTALALHQAPGLKIIAACEKYEFDNKYDTDIKYVDFSRKIFDRIGENKRKILPKVTIDSHGINEDCPRTGLSAEIFCKEENNYISSSSMAKLSYTEEANDELMFKYGNKYKFPTEFNELGHSKHEDSHLAVVHIDGNGFGKLFKDISTLEETKKLSTELKDTIQISFGKLLEFINKKLSKIKEELKIEKDLMPIRPIILGGDDITFVCDGRLGIFFAEKFIEYFHEQKIVKVNNLTMCAGVAIVKLKFPFYRAYLLAEELCGNAKKKRFEKNDEGDWIDYHISYSSFSGNISEIRENEFKLGDKIFTMKPYKLTKENFGEIINKSRFFTEKDINDDKQIFPRNKLKKLREFILEGGKLSEFTNQYPDLKIPDIFTQSDFFIDKETPYLDAIELTELYPFYLLNNRNDEVKN